MIQIKLQKLSSGKNLSYSIVVKNRYEPISRGFIEQIGLYTPNTDKLKNKETPTIFGDGEQTRDFIYVSDVVEANMKAATTETGTGQYFNIATGNKITLNQLLDTLCDIYNIDFKVNYSEMRKGDIKESYATVDKANSMLKWKAAVELSQGLKILCESL